MITKLLVDKRTVHLQKVNYDAIIIVFFGSKPHVYDGQRIKVAESEKIILIAMLAYSDSMDDIQFFQGKANLNILKSKPYSKILQHATQRALMG